MYKASCRDCDDFYIGETKRRSHDRKTEQFKVLSKNCQKLAIADHITSTGHNIKWDHFEILATGHPDIHCRIKELRIGSCLACVYRVMDARGKFGEHERSVRVARGAAESTSSFLSALQTSQVHP